MLAAQLDRLIGVIGLHTVELAIVPFSASLKLAPGHGFWMYGERLVVVEDRHAELRLEDADSIAVYTRTRSMFHVRARHVLDVT
ncbi:Scr1 family TA system antitoxin-like transcriptional regulator [Streptomyces sp. 2A115]|uniref:Scr1 family TA system antitoxin-like transcriptional regulator n=1 Tax=Streptomyces sp. 2A115 TaxID=3457439 RepID=UPI003FD35609